MSSKETINKESYYTMSITIDDNIEDILHKLAPDGNEYIDTDMGRIEYLISQGMITKEEGEKFREHYYKKDLNDESKSGVVTSTVFDNAELLRSRTETIKLALGISNSG
ncbi:hypothetical protein [Pleomorphochaeta sp. DL1XJH-081]|uniref:hypothetical protein n=1 Tax=Pleomorphochaeta sp. DL1XJH-081 TaxID=3409690 RepID=UPI003BB5B36E